MVYAVIDTNILVSAALAYNNKMSVPYSIFKAVADKRFVPLVDCNVIREYRDVLSRSKFSLERKIIDDIVNTILVFAINQNVPPSGTVLPDKDDIFFYDVAKAHQAKKAFLVTGNLKHFPNCPFAISARDFLNVLYLNESVLLLNDGKKIYDASGLLNALQESQQLAYKNGVANMSEEEIEAEIKAARAARKK